MKKLFILLIAVSFSICSFAQNEDTVVLNKEEYQQLKKLIEKDKMSRPRYYETKGFEHSVQFGSDVGFIDNNYGDITPLINLTYTAGYRFNDFIYLGGGAGVLFDAYTPGNPIDAAGDDMGVGCAFQNTTNGLIYANLKTYFTRTRLAPYFSLDVGTRFSKGQDCIGAYLSPSFGGHFRLNEKLGLFFSIGYSFYTSTVHDYMAIFQFLRENEYYIETFDDAIKLVEENSNNIETQTAFTHGLSFKIGITFGQSKKNK